MVLVGPFVVPGELGKVERRIPVAALPAGVKRNVEAAPLALRARIRDIDAAAVGKRRPEIGRLVKSVLDQPGLIELLDLVIEAARDLRGVGGRRQQRSPTRRITERIDVLENGAGEI